MIGIRIKNATGQDLNTFCKFLIPIIRKRALDFSRLNVNLEKLWDERLATEFASYPNMPTVKKILREYYNHLTISFDSKDNAYTITGDKNFKYPQLAIKLETLAALLTNGTLDTPRYPVFDEIYEDVKMQIPTLYKIWRVI